MMSQLTAKNMRDEFPNATIELLAKRVGQRCSNRSCLKPTSGPHTEPSKSISIGVAAHVTAASAGGPRYDQSLTPVERRSPTNGIRLCQSCSKLVDNDEVKYPVSVLREWKEKAEVLAAMMLQSRDLSRSEPPGQSLRPHDIDFAVDDWTMWRHRGNRPGDNVIFVSIWGVGDICYSCKIRLRNRMNFDEELQRLRVEFRQGEEVRFADDSAIGVEEITLPARKWTTLDVSHGLYDRSVFDGSDGVWFTAETVGDNETFSWQLARLDGFLLVEDG
jgi:hypothetical protein